MTARLTGIAFFLVFALYGYLSTDIQLDFWAEEEIFNARTFPQIIAAGGCIVSLLFAIAPVHPRHKDIELPPEEHRWGPVVGLVVLMALLSMVLDALGFIVTSILFLLAGFLLLGERRPLILFLASVPVVLILAVVMKLLGIHLDPGILGLFDD